MRERTATVAFVVAVFAVVAGVYGLTHNYRGITDTRLNSFQTKALVLHGDIDLGRYGLDVRDYQSSQARLAVERDGHVYSVYGVGVSIVAAPIYAVMFRIGMGDKAQPITAIGYSAGAAALLGLLLMRLFSSRVAVVGLIAFAFGTTLWPVASMAFFQQGPVLFFICVGLLGLLGSRQMPVVAGLGFATATLVRPTVGILLAVIGALYLLRGWRRLAMYCAGAALPLMILLVQNRWIWGSWLQGGYSESGVTFGGRFALRDLTFGWWRGIFIYSPFLILGVVGWIRALRRSEELERTLTFLGISGLLTALLYAKWADWGGGLNQFGYRLLLEIVPIAIVLAAYGLEKVWGLLPVGIALAIPTVLTMTWGATPRRDGFDDVMFARGEDTSFWRAWGNSFEHVGSSLLRLAVVVAACALLAAIARRAHPILNGAEARIGASPRRA